MFKNRIYYYTFFLQNRVPSVSVRRDNRAGVRVGVPVHGGVHAAAGRRVRGASSAGAHTHSRAPAPVYT